MTPSRVFRLTQEMDMPVKAETSRPNHVSPRSALSGIGKESPAIRALLGAATGAGDDGAFGAVNVEDSISVPLMNVDAHRITVK